MVQAAEAGAVRRELEHRAGAFDVDALHLGRRRPEEAPVGEVPDLRRGRGEVTQLSRREPEVHGGDVADEDLDAGPLRLRERLAKEGGFFRVLLLDQQPDAVTL